MKDHGTELTQLLLDWGGGDKEAFERLTALVYDELRRTAHGHMNRERTGHTLQTTALVNEAYVRLIDQRRTRWQNRARFFAIAAPPCNP
jgi:RNA polymerase sigma factor (TIGR02999 family)